MTLHTIPLTLRAANKIVADLHRHHKAARGCRFCIGVYDDKREEIVGAAIVSRPVARMIDQDNVAEVVRLATDGTKNACSVLYAACARAAKAMGYERIITYILEAEPGTSLLASGWTEDGHNSNGGQWSRPSRPRQMALDKIAVPKRRWSKRLNAPRYGLAQARIWAKGRKP